MIKDLLKDFNFKKTSVKVLNLNTWKPILCLLLKNCVGQISSLTELNNSIFKKL